MRAAVRARLVQLAAGHAGGAFLGGEERGEGLAGDFGLGVAEHAFGAAIPAGDAAVEVEREDRVVGDVVEDQRLPALGLAEGVRGAFPLGDIDEGDDDAGDVVVDGAVRERAAEVGAAGVADDLLLEGDELLEDGAGVVEELVVTKLAGEVAEGTADVAGDEHEQVVHRGREGGRRRRCRWS
jgi:hypothetical protein